MTPNPRHEIEALITASAKEEPFMAPLWLAGVLYSECKRQGLRNVRYTGDGFSVTVKITKPKASGRKR